MTETEVRELAYSQAVQIDSSPVATRSQLLGLGVTLEARIIERLCPFIMSAGQEYGTVSEIAKRFGRSVNTMKDWLRKLETDGKLPHTIQGCPSREGAKGDTLYHFGEVEKALQQVRKDYVTKSKNNG